MKESLHGSNIILMKNIKSKFPPKAFHPHMAIYIYIYIKMTNALRPIGLHQSQLTHLDCFALTCLVGRWQPISVQAYWSKRRKWGGERKWGGKRDIPLLQCEIKFCTNTEEFLGLFFKDPNILKFFIKIIFHQCKEPLTKWYEKKTADVSKEYMYLITRKTQKCFHSLVFITG